MSNLLKLGKKIISAGVTFTTIVWSVGVSALLPAAAVAAECPALNAGDMVKVKGQPAIYVLNNKMEVLAFPDGDVFKSWNIDNAYSGKYVSITDACYMTLKSPAAQPLFVNYRPGSYVVKRESSDTLHAVQPNNTLANIKPEAAKVLYGSAYKVMTVKVAHWGAYVNKGADITEAKVHPGMFVKKDGKTWYAGSDLKLQEVTTAGLTANRVKTVFVRTVPATALEGYTEGTKAEAEIKNWTDRTQSGGTVVIPPPVVTPAGALTVALATDTPGAATIVSDSDASGNTGAQAMIPVLKLIFNAGADGDVKVTSLKFKRAGVSADTDISNMYLLDGDTQLASSPSIASNMITFSNSAGLFTVAKGTSKIVMVKLDLKNNTAAGKTLNFSIMAKEDVGSNSTSMGGTFPVTSNTFTTALVSDLGILTLTNVSPTAAGTVDPGTNGFEIWRFTALAGDQDMEIRKIKFTIVGSINPGDLKNFTLSDGSKQMGSTIAEMASDKTVLVDMTASPHLLTKGQTRTLSLKADIVGGTNRTFYASIQNGGDLTFYDRGYQVFAKPNGNDNFTIIQAGGASSVNYTINTGSLTQTTPSDAPTGNIADGATNVTMAKFLWKAVGEDIKVTALNVSSTSAGSVDNILANVRLLVNGSQVGTTISSLTANGASNSGWGTFGNSFIIKAGTSATVTIVADTTNSTVAAGETFVIGFPTGSTNGQRVVSLGTFNTTSQTGNTLTVRGGTVSVVKNTAFGDKTTANPTGTVNATDVKVGSFVITAGAGEGVEVTQITLADGAASTCIGTSMQNLALKDSTGKQLGQTYPNPSSSCATVNTISFNFTPAVAITNGAQYVVEVYADLKAAVAAATNVIDLDAVTATGQNTGTTAGVSSQAMNLQNVVIAASGAFMAQVDPDTTVANNYLLGGTDQTIAKFRLSASSTEDISITQLVLSARLSTGATGTVKNIRLIDDATGTQIGSTVAALNDSVAGTSFATTTFSHATFSGLNLKAGKGVTKTVSVKADFTDYVTAGLSTTGQTVEVVILNSFAVGSNTFNAFTATGGSSGASLTPTISTVGTINAYPATSGAYGATSTLYRAKLTVAWEGDTPSGAASPSTAQTVAKFRVTNLANSGQHPATVNLVNLNFSTTVSNAAGSSAPALTIYKDSLSTLPALATTYFSTNGGSTGTPITLSGNSIITDANFTDVEISSGAYKTFWVTLDTSGAASQKSLSVRIPTAGAAVLLWTDGVSTSLTSTGLDLPLQFKTFTY